MSKTKRKRLQAVILILCLLSGTVSGVSGKTAEAERKKETIGVKQILDYRADGEGKSYLGYTSPTSGRKLRVSLHRTDRNEIAYCIDRTKRSDQNGFNHGYEVIENRNSAYADLERNILLCGYPGNSLKELKKMYGITEINERAAEQATQLAIWAGIYMLKKDVTAKKAADAHKPVSSGGMQAEELCRRILSRADEMLRQKFSVSGAMDGKEDKMVKGHFTIETSGQYYPLTGELSGFPEETVFEQDPDLKMEGKDRFTLNLIKGRKTIRFHFPDRGKEERPGLKLKGSVPIPPSFAGILFYDNRDSSYQSVVRVKEVHPFYGEKKEQLVWKPGKRGSLHLKKTSEDGKTEGIEFCLSGPDQFYKTYKTDSNGEIEFGELPEGEYTITEHAEDRYVLPEVRKISLKNGDQKKISFHNTLRKIKILVEKRDAEGNSEKGDGKLAGAEYTVYDDKGKECDVIRIGMDQLGESAELPAGLYRVKETKAPAGYNTDPEEYMVDGTKGDPSQRLISYHITSEEKMIRGKVRIHKVLENPDPDADTVIPAKGVCFTYYLSSDPSVKTRIILNEEGIGESGMIPYGTYILEEEKAPSGWKEVLPQTFRIEKEGEVLEFYLTDELDHAGCRIIKKDKGTGRPIAFSGTRFKIFRKDTMKPVSQTIPGPEHKKITEFSTNAEGVLMLPEKLQAGTYLLFETEAPEGYLKQKEPVEFTIPEHGEKTVEVVVFNEPVTAELKICKRGNLLRGEEIRREQNREIHLPVYEERPLQGTVYTLKALEDIKTYDGTVRIKRGETFQAETDQDGEAVFKGLYSGMYELEEIKAVNGFLRDTVKKEVIIRCEGSEEPVKKEEMHFTNRQQVPELILRKIMEKNPYAAVKEPWKEVLFGVYTAEEICEQKEDGSAGSVLIRKDALMDLYHIGESGTGVSEYHTILPYGSYYVKEIKTHPLYEPDQNRYEFRFCFEEEKGEKKEINVTETPIINRMITGELEFIKKDQRNGKLLPGCRIALFDEKHKKIAEGTTDREGKTVFRKLPAGIYFYKEVKAPEGYRKDEKTYKIRITKDQERISVLLKNEKIKKPVTGEVKTGDPFSVGTCISLCLITAACILVLLCPGKHKKEQ